MDILLFEEFMEELNEALTPEERREKRKQRRLARKEAQPKTGNQNLDADIEDMDDMTSKPSKSMTTTAERYRTEMLKLQDLQREFVLTSKDDVVKRESLKKKLVVQTKIARQAEAEFEKMVSAEEDDFAQDLFFE
jgi:hypothetical protein